MALINCPECGEKISDKSKVCIHCGFPLNTYSQNETINGIEIDINWLKNTSISQVQKIKKIQEDTGCDIFAAKNIVLKYHQSQQTQIKDGLPKCPHCRSTNIKSISGLNRSVSIAVWGIASKKISKSFECKNCGYTW